MYMTHFSSTFQPAQDALLPPVLFTSPLKKSFLFAGEDRSNFEVNFFHSPSLGTSFSLLLRLIYFVFKFSSLLLMSC